MLALVAFGAAGLVAELLLLEHWESPWQWTPLVLLAVTCGVAARAVVRPAPGVLRALRAVMALCVLAGVVGVLLHYKGNVEFELERAGALRGWALFAESVRGATPALAPGAMAQLGLLGLAATWRHPALRAASSAAPGALGAPGASGASGAPGVPGAPEVPRAPHSTSASPGAPSVSFTP